MLQAGYVAALILKYHHASNNEPIAFWSQNHLFASFLNFRIWSLYLLYIYTYAKRSVLFFLHLSPYTPAPTFLLITVQCTAVSSRRSQRFRL